MTVDVALGRAFRLAEMFMFWAHLALIRARFVQIWLPTCLVVLKVGWRVIERERERERE